MVAISCGGFDGTVLFLKVQDIADDPVVFDLVAPDAKYLAFGGTD